MSERVDPAPGNMEEALAEWLEAIDAGLSKGSVPLPSRPFEACRIFIDRALLAVDSTKIAPERFDEYLESAWFKKLYRAVHDWYEDRYGKALRAPDSYLTSTVLISGLPFEVRIPTTRRKVEEPGKTAWITFPAEVQDDENPRSWLRSAPNLDRLGEDANASLRGEIEDLATYLRTLQLDLSCSEKPDPGCAALASRAIPHLESAAAQLLRGDRGDLGLAAWDSHQAPESVLKLLRRQAKGKHRHSHDLSDLLSDLAPAVRAGIDSALVASLPSGQRIVEIRAGDGARLSLAATYDIYRRSILLAHQAAQHLQSGVRVHNASFLIQKLPWID